MYKDPVTREAYGHNHAVYVCACGTVIDQCRCKSTDKELIELDNCMHGGKRFPAQYDVIVKSLPRRKGE